MEQINHFCLPFNLEVQTHLKLFNTVRVITFISDTSPFWALKILNVFDPA